jgi:hypothetical protein
MNPARWSPDDWKDITRSWDRSGAAWTQIMTPSDAHKSFPVVENINIPVRGLFVFMFLFVILIGPINLYWLARINRRLWLLWTVPVFSLVTSVLLFGYMAITEGWRGHLRAFAITVLDEPSQRAASIGWLGYYAPTTPGGGLHFSVDTELSPHFNSEFRHYREARQAATMDWTEDQHLDSGWLVAKVPLHFCVRRNEKRQERLIARRESDSIRVVNGLKADIATLWLADKDGKLWKAENVRAGADASLARDKTEPKATPTGEPADRPDDGLSTLFGQPWLAAAQKLERSPERYLRPGTYLAVIEDLPFLDDGLGATQTRVVHSLVYGVLKEAP